MNTKYDIENDQKKIEIELAKYISIIIKEYSPFIQNKNKEYLEKNIGKLTKFSTNNSISFVVKNKILYLPKSAYSVIEELSKTKNYGINLNNKVPISNYLDTNTDYYQYIAHVIEKGLTPIEYFKESLLHEAMHLCGSNGGSGLEEGINELKTRELAMKYDIEIAGYAYPKEVEIAKRLQEILGSKTMDELCFMDQDRINDYLNITKGKELANLYLNISKIMKEENNNYNRAIQSISNPLDKAKEYDKICYQKVYSMLDEYKKSQIKK